MTTKLLYFKDKRQATWLELFFDLIFVVSIGKITHFLSNTHHHHLEHGAWWMFVLTFIPLWWIWVGHTVYANRFDEDSRKYRVVTLVLMFLLIIMSVVIGHDIVHKYKVFIAIYGISRLSLASMHYYIGQKYSDQAKCSKKISLFYLIGAIISSSAVFFELPAAIFIFYSGLLFDIFTPTIFHRYINPMKAHKHHLVERIGLLAIILLGESIISMSGSLSHVTWNALTIVTASCGFLMVCMIWWIYFDSFVLLTESKHDSNGNAILYSQLATYMALAILANTIRHAILNDLDITEFRIMAIFGMMLFYFGKQTAYFINVPEYRKYIILNTFCMLMIAAFSLLLPSPQYILMGMAFSMIVYIALNFRAQIRLYGYVNL